MIVVLILSAIDTYMVSMTLHGEPRLGSVGGLAPPVSPAPALASTHFACSVNEPLEEEQDDTKHSLYRA